MDTGLCARISIFLSSYDYLHTYRDPFSLSSPANIEHASCSTRASFLFLHLRLRLHNSMSILIDIHSAYIQTMHTYIDTYVQTNINTCTSTYIHANKHHDVVACIHTCVHSSFALTRARAKLLYNSSNFQYFVAAMIILGFVQDVVDAQILPVKVLFLVAYVR